MRGPAGQLSPVSPSYECFPPYHSKGTTNWVAVWVGGAERHGNQSTNIVRPDLLLWFGMINRIISGSRVGDPFAYMALSLRGYVNVDSTSSVSNQGSDRAGFNVSIHSILKSLNKHLGTKSVICTTSILR